MLRECLGYMRRLDQLNRDFNKLWDFLVKMGFDPEKIIYDDSRG